MNAAAPHRDRRLVRQAVARSPRCQRGAATLLVVMVLFFVVSLVAAYASRNLLFEQKTAANQYRSTAVLEAADAGLHWAISLLNGGRIGATCLPSGNPTDTSFRERYLAIDDAGAITPRTLPAPSTVALNPSCVFDGNGWQCSCPDTTAPALAAPGGNEMFPAFRLRFSSMPGRPGLVRIEVNACSRADNACLDFPATGAANEARVTVSALLALKGGLAAVPAAALTAKGSVNSGSALGMTLVNTDPRVGVTVNAGGAVTSAGLNLVTAPGSPAAASIVEEPAVLGALSTTPANNMMFARTFGLWPADYRLQPGAVELPCGGTCTAAQVRTAIAQHPGLVIWVDGALDVDTGGDIGTAEQPVVIVATGGVQFTAAATVYGMIYTQAAPWTTSGAATTVRGAVVAEGNVDGDSSATLVYDADILNRLRLKTGSFVVVPGSWRDF